MKSIILILFTAITHNILGVYGSDNPLAKIDSGELQGTYMQSRDSRQYSAFLGIPYAKPSKRFQLAEFPEKWTGIKNATTFGDNCPQLTFMNEFLKNENCLFLNVYSPTMTGDLPVMVFIHGGAFVMGSSDMYGAGYFMDEDIVLVTINYRLGVLGFLNTGDGEMEGNLGLKDQNLALKWVQKNIKQFGGNPNKVTIFGESAGSASVHYHVLSPLSKGLFSNAIMESGSAINPWAHRKDPRKEAFALGNALGCNAEDDTSKLMKCLEQADFIAMYNASISLTEWISDPVITVPSTEKPGNSTREIFLPDSPMNILKSGNYNKVPVTFTICEDEGILIRAATVLSNKKYLKEINEDYLRVLPIAMYYNNDGYSVDQQNEISKKIKAFYFGDKAVGKETFQNLTNMYSDRAFITGIENAITLHSNNVEVFSGVFTYKGTFSLAKLFGIQKSVVSHADEVQYLFQYEMLPNFPPGSKSENASKYFVSLWTNFAKSGNPGAKWTHLEWEAANATAMETTGVSWWDLNFPPQILVNPFGERIKFWKETLGDIKP